MDVFFFGSCLFGGVRGGDRDPVFVSDDLHDFLRTSFLAEIALLEDRCTPEDKQHSV